MRSIRCLFNKHTLVFQGISEDSYFEKYRCKACNTYRSMMTELGVKHFRKGVVLCNITGNYKSAARLEHLIKLGSTK